MAKPHRGFFRRLASITTTTLLLLAVLHVLRTAAEDEQSPWPICGPEPSSGNYPQNSTYHTNINLLSASLPRNASSSAALYATGNVGDVPNIVYGQALCRGDVANASACETCVANAFPGAQRVCPLYKDVVIFYDFCQLRFSNRNFLVDDDYIVTTYILQRSRLVGSPAFDGAVGLLVNATAEHVVEDSSRRFSTGEEGFDDSRNSKIYALSQCTPDITADVCRKCLNVIIGQLPIWFSRRTGGAIFGVWCNFRYEVYPFFSGRPLVQLPQFVGRPPASAPPVIRGGEKRRNSTGKVLAILMPTIAVMLVVAVVYFFCWRRRRPEEDAFLPSASDDIQDIDSLLLDLETLRVATDDFDNSKMLGRGGFGIVYKGVLPDGQEIAVKRLCQTSRQGIGELKSELVLVAKLHHRNLVRLVGVCLEEQEKILVYEYMPKRSLDTILFDSEQNKELDWRQRFKIVNGIARGLQYLHQDSQLKIVHRDLKASNILLDFDYNPKISDFGLAKLFRGDQSEDVTSRIAGTYGYMAPEYAMRGQYSIKSDVFSFGVLVLEIVTGRRNDGSYNIEQDIDLVNLVWEHWNRGNVIEMIDPSLSNHPPVDQILKCIHVGLLCVQRKPASRPTMSSVNIMFSSHTVRLPSLSRPPFFIQEVGVSESSTAHSDAYLPGENSTVMSSNQVSITELSPR
ncbi:cysteine-rich receptor-like protein kinase 6 isoform X2 [Triticum aestivum]|uniref:cysteine-rich receptor-like protein kinase 6 isoform X2 n=1 Tax=Triticum aestivum TaxID=4565 RepID=UPI001D00A159|nr:cysteine-rich receptor-like protein kinase 6 isoform X2 [Triticum aestivum]